MMYFKPHIDKTGIHIPLYSHIRDSLVAEAKLIFGEDIYLEPDSQDYQLISAFAEKINDSNELAVQLYNNRVPAVPGRDIETDAFLRARQAISTANPSKTVLQGIEGGIAALLNVTRYRAYENDTSEPDENGIPGHSNSFVVEGGDSNEIASILYLRKTPGSGTYGDVQIQVQITESTLEEPPPICFFRPRYVDVFILVQVKPLAGYVTQITQDIRKNICEYLNTLEIGEDLTVSALYVPAMAATPSIAAPCFSILRLLIGTEETDLSSDDMRIQFNQVTRGMLGRIKVVPM